MDFMNLAKQGYEAYSQSQSGGQSDDQQQQQQPPQLQHQSSGVPQIDHDQAVQYAQQNGSGDSSMFSKALAHVTGNPAAHKEPIDEEGVVNAHAQAYEQGNAGGLSAGSMGAAAAMHALQSFTSGGGGGAAASGGGSTQLVSMAMSEASNLFDSSGGAASGSKQDVISGAASTVMKLLFQYKMKSMMGGSSSGGLGSLMGMAGQFL